MGGTEVEEEPDGAIEEMGNKPQPSGRRPSFSDFATSKFFFYLLMLVLLITLSLVAVFSEWIVPCPARKRAVVGTFPNPAFNEIDCRTRREAKLLQLTPLECDLTRRTLASVMLGTLIGVERRRADRPAGVRTMGLVSLGACLFTIDSMFAFVDGPESWDSSRVAAAIPSGVGFLGAGVIYKGSTTISPDGLNTPQVHGLTTATSVWLSAAVGIAAGGALYFIAFFSSITLMAVLRFCPHAYNTNGDGEGDDAHDAKYSKAGTSDCEGGLANEGEGSDNESDLDEVTS